MPSWSPNRQIAPTSQTRPKRALSRALTKKLNFDHPPQEPVLSGLSAWTRAKVTPHYPTGCVPEPKAQEYVALALSNQNTGCTKKFCNHITVKLIQVIRLGPFKSRQIVRKRPAPAVAKIALPSDSALAYASLHLPPHCITPHPIAKFVATFRF